MTELPTDEELARWEHLVKEHVENQPLPLVPTVQGLALAELVRAVPRLLALIRIEREAHADDMRGLGY